MKIYKKSVIICVALLALVSTTAFSEEKKKSKAEELVEMPVQGQKQDLNQLRRGSLTEEQAVNQLKYMMVMGWSRMEKQLLEIGGFLPFGMVLSPEGEFNVLAIENQLLLKKEYQLSTIVEYLQKIAQSRTKWAVGLMYVETVKNDDGSSSDYITVIAEHIAGWARSWSYMYKVVDGEIKLAAPKETVLKPVYFVEKK